VCITPVGNEGGRFLKIVHFRQGKEHQNLSGLTIAHRDNTRSKYFNSSFLR
jgi:hypothetical protein